MDALVSGVHFPPAMTPATLGYRSLAVNLSDMAAMGARPRWLNLALTLPNPHDDTWLNDFYRGLSELADAHDTMLDATRIQPGPLSVSIEIWGEVPIGAALCRRGAQPGDGIYVTGTLGDAGLAIQVMERDLELNAEDLAWVERRYSHPTPRVAAGLQLRNTASAAIDLSDGLVGDLGHILEASAVGATLELDALPLSPACRNSLPREQAWKLALGAGDDYELCFTAPPEQRTHIGEVMDTINCPVHHIGRVEARSGLRCHNESGTPFTSGRAYQHFS